ncbi:MAG: hypothetical protein ABIJ20_04635 [Nanoarchaeota archaeon]|nr:hypothetical protein [Nanoarchaeota archaeon]MBU1445092.1 hypothetical protein [Nanoarchaeota archaeon]MBU2406553.1 hypothetical protein [Nanoarchaeota archaeon]MBU2420347.1 hypothetical protein [Nanoarchaeota archaeon]MBU2474955.1 hypothetical protein [Nanoarchaeota archaeon]
MVRTGLTGIIAGLLAGALAIGSFSPAFAEERKKITDEELQAIIEAPIENPVTEAKNKSQQLEVGRNYDGWIYGGELEFTPSMDLYTIFVVDGTIKIVHYSRNSYGDTEEAIRNQPGIVLPDFYTSTRGGSVRDWEEIEKYRNAVYSYGYILISKVSPGAINII